MSMKVVLVAAASVMAVSPALAMTRSEIVHHSGGPIPYSQLVSLDKSGYNARSHRRHKASGATVAPTSAAAGAVNAPDGSADAAANGAAAPSSTPSTDATAGSSGAAAPSGADTTSAAPAAGGAATSGGSAGQ